MTARPGGGITFRPVAVRNKVDAAALPGGWRFGDQSGPTWGGSGMAFHTVPLAGHVKAEPQQGHAVPAHSANCPDAAGTAEEVAGQSTPRSLARAPSGQLTPEPSLRDPLRERSGDSNAGAIPEPDVLSPLPHDNHSELPLESRNADGRAVGEDRGMPRSCSHTTLTRCGCQQYSSPPVSRKTSSGSSGQHRICISRPVRQQ